MITPSEVKEQCLKWWKDVLIASVNSNSFFPKEVSRIGKVKTKDILSNLSAYNQAIQQLQNSSKEFRKNSYKITWEERIFDKIGKQKVPDKILIDSLDDYLWITGKEKEYEIFIRNNSLINQELPLLQDWILVNPIRLIEHDTWNDTLKVCKYFMENPRPNLYIRQLPIEIHTKYISENETIIQSLLEFLIPGHINHNEKKFEKRFNLKYPEPLIRVRFLDKQLSPIKSTTDISLTLSEFKNFNCDCNCIFVAENLMNFLTLPHLPNTLSIWSGGGFNISYLKESAWIKNKQFYYWGDIDAHGFQILNQFRSYFPKTIAVMMNEETLSYFNEMVVEGEPAKNQSLQCLSESEAKFYDYLKKNNIRLEQEKITQNFAEEKINNLFKNQSFAKRVAP